MYNLTQMVKFIRHSAAVAVGTTTITPDGINVRGFRSVTFVVSWGTITDAPGIYLQQSDDDGDADDYTNVRDSLIQVSEDADNGLTVIELYNPEKQWLKCIVERGGVTGSVVDGILALLADSERPPDQLAGIALEFHDREPEGDE